MVAPRGNFRRTTEQQLLNFFLPPDFFWDVVEPSNEVSARVDQKDGWVRASLEEDGEDAADNAMGGATELARDSVGALVPARVGLERSIDDYSVVCSKVYKWSQKKHIEDAKCEMPKYRRCEMPKYRK